jgi:hypothetical protein
MKPKTSSFFAMNQAATKKTRRIESAHSIQLEDDASLGTPEAQFAARSVPHVYLECIIIKLIQAGADIHHILPEDFDRFPNWRALETLWNYAQVLDIGKNGSPHFRCAM